MLTTVVASLCHAIVGITNPVCREVVVITDDMPMQMCIMSQAALAEWKEHSIYKGDDWTLQGYRCTPGHGYARDTT